MSNSMKNRLNRKGFTLAEVLVTVAIILILAGVTFVSVGQYQKNLRLMEMDGTAKEIFIAAQNHLSVAKASGDLDRLAEEANADATGTTASTIGTKLDSTLVSAYAGNASGNYYYVIHNVTNGTESCTPSGSDAILQMMLPFGALDETVSASGNYAIVYELDSASVVAVLYSGAGNASFGNAAVINFGDEDVKKISEIYNDKSKRKSYEKNGVTAIVGCYTGTAGSAAIPTETLEAPTLEVRNENQLHVIVSDKNTTYTVTLIIRGVQSGTVAKRILKRDTSDGNSGTGTFDVILDDITGDGSYRFANIISSVRFTKTEGDGFIPGENIEISARVSSTTGLATPKESAKYTVSSLFGDVNETKDAGNSTVYIKNLRHLENLGANVSGFTAALGNDATTGNAKLVNITAEQKNDITMFAMSTSGSAGGNHFENLRGSTIYGMEQEATFAAIDVNYPLVYHGNQHEIHGVSIGAQQDHTDAGIFGQVADPTSSAANASLSVSDLILRNNRVSVTNVQNAGMLVGETTKNLTVDGVLSYYHEDTYDETKDSSIEVAASQNAGGLIGLVAGGKLEVKNSAAAVYVKGGSAAGGLIGSVAGAETGSTIGQSYAGGHTKDGAYSTTDATKNQPVLEGSGRYNVQATQASGYAGGFIGVTTNNVRMNAVYSTASAYSSAGDANSDSFAGNGVPNISTDADGKKNYYAIGPHNGTDASADDTAKAQLAAGQNLRQATAYDRTLMGATASAAHPAMDKTSYPLNTIRHLCATGVDDKDLPWFIKEHVGDWVVSKKTEESNFEVENGNRLTVRINTGLDQITEDLYYEVKVHGQTRENDAYFLLHIKPDSTVDVQRKYNNNEFKPYNFNIAKVRQDITPKKVELYLDDITNRYGNFISVCDGNFFYPGEDISINVISLTSNNDKDAVYDDSKIQYTNSLFGYLQNEGQDSSSHNLQKINAVKNYVENAGTEANGLGLIPNGDGYYVQIDNSRHLENLSKNIGYPWAQNIGNNIVGAIQTDNIYWSGSSESNAYTKGFQEELGVDLNVFSKDGLLTQNGYYCPIINTNLKLYDGSGFRISGVNALEQAQDAALFVQIESDVTIKNLTLEKASFKSETKRAAGLISYAGRMVTIDKVYATGGVEVRGSDAAAGFVAHAANSITINNSSIENGNINSTNNKAGGLVAYAGQAVTITNVKCTGKLNVIGYSETGGVAGRAENSITVTDSGIENGSISSTNGDSAGIVSYAGQSVTIDKVNCIGGLIISGKNKAAGFVAQAANSITITNSGIENGDISSTNGDAAGLISYAGQSATINKVNSTGGLIINGKNKAAGFVAEVRNSITITNSGIENGTIKSSDSNAGGLVGYTAADSTLSNITLGNKDSAKEDLNSEFHVQSNGKNWQNASAGGLIARADGAPTIKDVHLNVRLTVENTNTDLSNPEQDAVGGLIGYVNAKTNIEDCRIKNGSIKSIGTRAGGFVGCGQNDITIKNSIIDTIVVRSSKSCSGGFVGTANGYSVINATGLLADSLITSSESDAGGVIGYAKNIVNITNTKVIGTNTEIIAGSGNAGGLIGGFENSNLTINNSAVSVFVRAESGNAGGLIGGIKGLTAGSSIKNSYYGGRTIKGIYGGITVHKGDSDNERIYAANIIAGSASGGLIGAIEGQNWQQQFDISQCYSSGSVQIKSGPAGGFIGNANLNGGICLNINQCYSIGPVLKSDNNTAPIRGGFIGLISTSTTNDIRFVNAYYLSSFNADTLNAIGASNNLLSTAVQEINSADSITGQDAVANLTAKNATYVFDETLKGKEPYPYQNWTTENGTITYYGDWPVPQINGTLVYYHRDDGDKKKGICTLISSETSFQSLLTTQDGEVERFGFGIILDSLPQDWDCVSELYIWSDRKEGPFTIDKTHQMRVTKKYLTFYYGGRNYTFARVTNDELPKEHFYVKNMTTEDVYEVTYDENTAEVKVVSEANA